MTTAKDRAAEARADATMRNVWQRINDVRADVTTVAKDKTVGTGDHAYKVATHEAVKMMLRPLMAKHGLVDYIQEIEYIRVGTGIMRGGNTKRELISHQAKYLYIVVNADDPSDTHSIPVRGDGEDSGDKGPGKASTYALKAGQKILFMVSADEDEEERIDEGELHNQETVTIDPAQIDNLLWLAKKLFEEDSADQMKRMCHALFSIDEIAQLPAEHYQHAINALNNQADRVDEEAQKKRDAQKEISAAMDEKEKDTPDELPPPEQTDQDGLPPTSRQEADERGDTGPEPL